MTRPGTLALTAAAALTFAASLVAQDGLVGALPAPIKTGKPAYLSLNQVREGVKALYKNLWALEVEFVQTSSKEDPEIIPKMPLPFRVQG